MVSTAAEPCSSCRCPPEAAEPHPANFVRGSGADVPGRTRPEEAPLRPATGIRRS